MNIIYKLNRLDILRPIALPRNIGPFCLITLLQNLPLLGEFMAENPRFKMEQIIIADPEPNSPKKMLIGNAMIPIETLEHIGHFPQYEKLFLGPDNGLLTQICRILAHFEIDNLWLVGAQWPENFCMRQPQPDFFSKNAPNLRAACSLLEDETDRDVFLRRIKAIMTGNAAYLPISKFDEYKHPLIQPRPGDIMIDGGVSDMVWAQEDFAEKVGESGKIYGFEPIPWMAEKAAQQLARYKQYHLVCAGLADKSGEAIFDSLRDSSHISQSGTEAEGKIRCRLDSIDEFAKKENLHHVDCIKLDIEGAELSALHGAREIIKRDGPKLIICLYHKPVDLFTIPLYIHSLAPRYKMHLAHSSCGFTDTILYAWIPACEDKDQQN